MLYVYTSFHNNIFSLKQNSLKSNYIIIIIIIII